MLSPYKGSFKVSQIYKGSRHKGIDLVGLDSKDIYATLIGTVEAVGYDTHYTGGMGLYIRIRQDKTNHRYYFAHLSKVSVKVGQRVSIGDKIGVEGNTGASTGSHLHYEIREVPSNLCYLNVSEISGIPNKLGVYHMKEFTFNEALEILVKHGVIESPSYWQTCSTTTFYIKELIINMAKCLERK